MFNENMHSTLYSEVLDDLNKIKLNFSYVEIFFGNLIKRENKIRQKKYHFIIFLIKF